MMISVDECLTRVPLFDDNIELANELISIAETIEDTEGQYAYYLRESADNLIGLNDLLRCMAHHLKRLTTPTTGEET
jgi:hypothetical protein